MKLSTAILLLISVATVESLYTSNKYGLYRGSDYTRAFSIVLKPDSTFEYRLRGHMIGDTSAGNYHLKGDTIYFNYT